MAHPATPEAADAPALGASDKAADFENYLFGEDEEQDDEPEAEGDEDEDLDLEDEDAGEDEDEPESPAIEPPASLNADEKKAFAQLPPEAQQAWAASENRRNSQVQEATTKASHAQREAEARAAAADAEAKAVYAQQLKAYTAAVRGAFAQAPDPNMAYSDPARYIAEKAQYDALSAHFDQFEQQASALSSEADQAAVQNFVAQRDRELMQIPEIANPETRETFIKKAIEIGTEALGYSVEDIQAKATAAEIQNLAKIADWRAKAEKYDKAMAGKMQKVRAGKARSLRPNAAPHADARAAGGDKAWQRVKTARSKDAQAEAFADFMGL